MSPSPIQASLTSAPRGYSWLPGYGFWLAASLVGLAGALGYYGADFYLTGVQARVDHPAFRALSPSGPVGQTYGLVGTALILTNLLYLLRRRFPRLPMGAMRAWLDVHVFTGLFGSLLVTFHSAFQLRSGIAKLTALSLGVVVLTGLVGRYLYAISPRRDPRPLQEAMASVDQVWPALGQHLRQLQAAWSPPTVLPRPGLLSALLTVPTWMGEARMRRRTLRHAARHAIATTQLAPAQARAIVRQVDAVGALCAAEVKTCAGEHLLRSWRGLHRFMAVLMIVSVSLHIAVALYFGFGWSPS